MNNILEILTHLACRANAKNVYIVKALKVRGKRALADVNYYCKMTSVLTSDGLTSFLRFKDTTYSCKRVRFFMISLALFEQLRICC